MKPDGVNMETTEPTEAAAVAEHPPLQDNTTEQAPSQPGETANDVAPEPAPKANGKPVAADPKAKPKAVAAKMPPTAKSAGASRAVTSSQRTVNDVKCNNVSAAAKKATTTTSAKASSTGPVSKRPVGGAAVSSTLKNQTKVPDRKPVGAARTTSAAAAATVTNGTKPTTANGTPKRRPVAETVKPKTTASSSRPAASTAPKPSSSTTTRPAAGAMSKTTRPATAPPSSRPASTTTSRPASSVTNKPCTTTAAKTVASRATTAPSTGRTTTAQMPKTAAAKKDVSRPPPAAVAKKPSTTTTSSTTKKPESSKPTPTIKQNSASKLSTTAKTAETKVSQTKAQPPAKSAPAKKPAAAARLPALNKPPTGRTPPVSPANKSANSSTALSKRGAKPTQAVLPFTAVKKTGVSNTTTPAVETQHADNAAVATVASVAAATAAIVLAESQSETAVSPPQESSPAEPALEDVSLPVLAQDTTPDVEPEETVQSHVAASSPLESLVTTQTTSPQEHPERNAPLQTTQEQIPATADPAVPPVASSSDLQKESVNLFTDQTPSFSQAPPASPITQLPPQSNLNEEEDEEEREGSQQVSVSEMSGTTQPTEESRPGSAGLVRGSAWRASGALLSELDSEEVSGSQQGASELSAPGVLEGTESMDDLGDGSLKGAIDMEGASAGSPDFEKVPDIPVNDFDEDEEDDDYDDRVCDMDVGSERADEPQRPRHDNDVAVDEDEEDEDVEMASEGVTESGLESYGNADEDDFAEDERLDNLNRVVEPPPPPPVLPSAPAAQWDQPNPFADHWAEPLQPQQVLEHVSQAAAAASPLADPWQADSETPTQTPAQAWLELGSGPFGSEEAPYQSSVKDEPENLEARMYMDQSSPATMLTLPPAVGMSLSSTLSSETSTPEELADPLKLQPQDARLAGLSPQPDLYYQEKEDQEGEEEEAEAETLPADEVLGGPATAPTSNPSSTSVTEDEASDTEGEAQLEDSLESPAMSKITFDSQSATRRCLSTVEEGEEAEVSACAGEDITPPSATSLASYGFDTTTTASNSNAQSTGENCVKSPGIFSLEELSEEAKEPFLIPQSDAQLSLAEQQYIDCGKQEAESAENVREEEEALDPSSTPLTMQQTEENPEDIQPPYYSAICEKTENSYAGFTALPHRRDHAAYPRTYCDIIKPHTAAVTPPKLTCADLPPRSLGQQALSPQLRRLEQHQKQLLEMQHRREQQSRPLEEAEQERKRREEEEQRKKKEEAEEEIKRNKEEMERKLQEQVEAVKKEEEEQKLRKEEELKQRRDLELQLQQQQEELKQRQQILQWQQELQESNKGQTVVLSPSSGLCTIYEALENTDEEEGEDEGIKELNRTKKKKQNKQETSKTEKEDACERVKKDEEKHEATAVSTEDPPPPPRPDSPQTSSNNSQDGDSPLSLLPESPERPPPLDLDWGKKVDIVQQLINQTLMLNRDGCSSLLLLPGGAGGTLSPLESSLWPSLLPPLTPPSATVTSVSSFSPEATGSSPQGEWTVVELETHH
ncbi:uncharacterized protein prr36a [Tautogolabrus adspersus]